MAASAKALEKRRVGFVVVVVRVVVVGSVVVSLNVINGSIPFSSCPVAGRRTRAAYGGHENAAVTDTAARPAQ